MNETKMAVTEVIQAERSKTVKAMMEALDEHIKSAVVSAASESSDLIDEENEKMITELQDELTEYVRRGLMRGIKRIYTEYNK